MPKQAAAPTSDRVSEPQRPPAWATTLRQRAHPVRCAPTEPHRSARGDWQSGWSRRTTEAVRMVPRSAGPGYRHRLGSAPWPAAATPPPGVGSTARDSLHVRRPSDPARRGSICSSRQTAAAHALQNPPASAWRRQQPRRTRCADKHFPSAAGSRRTQAHARAHIIEQYTAAEDARPYRPGPESTTIFETSSGSRASAPSTGARTRPRAPWTYCLRRAPQQAGLSWPKAAAATSAQPGSGTRPAARFMRAQLHRAAGRLSSAIQVSAPALAAGCRAPRGTRRRPRRPWRRS